MILYLCNFKVIRKFVIKWLLLIQLGLPTKNNLNWIFYVYNFLKIDVITSRIISNNHHIFIGLSTNFLPINN